MKLLLSLTLVAGFSFIVAHGQILKGVVLDIETGKPIDHASVAAYNAYQSFNGSRAVTDSNGRFEVPLFPETVILIRHIGFADIKARVSSSEKNLIFKMQAGEIRLPDLRLNEFPKPSNPVAVGNETVKESKEGYRPRAYHAHFPGGWANFVFQLGNVIYDIRRLNGFITVHFVIDTTGQVTELHSSKPKVDKLLLKRFQTLKWRRALQEGIRIPERFVINIDCVNAEPYKFYKYLYDRTTIPEEAYANQVSGRYRIGFKVNKYGRISGIDVTDADPEYRQEISNMISQTPRKIAKTIPRLIHRTTISVMFHFHLDDLVVPTDPPFLWEDIYRVREVLITHSKSEENRKRRQDF